MSRLHPMTTQEVSVHFGVKIEYLLVMGL